jgi:hypothetical protein
MLKAKYLSQGFLAILLFTGFIWVQSGYGKLASGNFSQSLAGILQKFASDNPNGWYKALLEQTAIPNASAIGMFIPWVELLTGLSIMGAVLSLFFSPKTQKAAEKILATGLAVAFLLNLNFYFAAGWTSPSTSEVNLLMLVVEAIGVGVILFK